jgi:DNA-binding LytR/AlgR family response regulator
MKTQCLIVDDEPLAIEIIERYLQNFSDMKIAGRCNNAFQAFEILKKQHIDLIFLDIQMPQITGISFIGLLNQHPKIIITTAYRDYALDGFELNVLDYLLKPISLERFIKAIDKYYSSIAANETSNPDLLIAPDTSRPSIFVKAERKMVRVFLDEIYLIESLKEYVIIHKKDKKIITKNSISYFEEILPKGQFIRIHRSYIVSISQIEAYTQTTIELLKKELPIGRNYKNEVLKCLGAVRS